jgi:exosortase/archaeosortase family protein
MSSVSAQSPSSPGRTTSALDLGRLFPATIFILIANAVATKVINAFTVQGWATALAGGLGLSWAFWLSFALCVRLALAEPSRAPRPRDLWVCGVCLLAAVVPVSQVSALACTALALVILFDRTQGVLLKASAMVLAAISVQLLWSRLVMLLFLGPIAELDAFLVSLTTGSAVHGNTVQFVDGARGGMAILEGCTSVQNASIALMLFVAIVRTFRPAPRWSELYMFAGLFMSIVAINIVRLTLMAQNVEMFHRLHGDTGWVAINTIITVTALLWAAMSVRREIFD